LTERDARLINQLIGFALPYPHWKFDDFPSAEPVVFERQPLHDLR
jgi:hypothetical protein